MKYVCRVHVIHGDENLVHEVLNVVVGKFLVRIDNIAKISLHEVCDEVHIRKGIEVSRRRYIEKIDNLREFEKKDHMVNMYSSGNAVCLIPHLRWDGLTVGSEF